MGRRPPAALWLAAVALLAGCGDSAPRDEGPPAKRSPARKAAARSGAAAVIERWADTLRRGDVERAAELFAVPATVANGEAPRRLTTRAEVRAFNESLPCGARLVAARRRGGYTIALFRLTRRPGGDCGLGVGDLAATAFRLRAGRIVEWLRVPPTSGAPPPASPPPGSGTS